MSEIKLEDDHLDASHGPTKMLLAAEYWKRKAEYLKRRIKQLEMKMSNAAKIVLEDIEANIASEHYFNAGDAAYPGDVVPSEYEHLSLLTFCVLVLCNGFTVTGQSACVSPENFNAEIGRKIARENAIQNVWPLMAYALKEKLAEK